MTVRQALGPGGPFYRSHAAGRQVQSRLEAEGKILPHIKYNQEGYNMNEFLPKELKDYIAQNQDTLVKLLDTLCRIPAPSNHEELRAEFIRDWFEKEGCRGAYIDSALNVIYPFHCESQKDLLAFTAHSDTVFPDMEPLMWSMTATSCGVPVWATIHPIWPL